MLLNDPKFTNSSDAELAGFAKAVKQPVGIAIIRTIIAQGNTATKTSLTAIPFPPEMINKQISKLKTLGLVQTTGTKNNIQYCINRSLFNQLANSFITLLQ